MGKTLAAILISIAALSSAQQPPLPGSSGVKIEIPDWDNAVQFDLVASQQPVRPGDSFELAVVADIQPGYHLYGPEEPEPTRTEVTLVGDSLDGGEPSYPPPIERELEGLGTYRLYEGRIAIRVPVTAPAAIESTMMATSVEVAYQICTDFACSAPATKELALQLPTAPKGMTVRPLHPDIFKKK